MWVDEALAPRVKNIYGATKLAAEDLCRLFHRNQGLPCVILRTSRFFPEPDDDPARRGLLTDANIKTNEYLYRRVDIEDLIGGHLLAIERAPAIGFGRYILTATTPFRREDAAELRENAAAVLARRVPQYRELYERLGWQMFAGIGRVYDNALARSELGWRPVWDFAHVLERLRRGEDPRSPLAQAIGMKGYHDVEYADGIYPV